MTLSCGREELTKLLNGASLHALRHEANRKVSETQIATDTRTCYDRVVFHAGEKKQMIQLCTMQSGAPRLSQARILMPTLAWLPHFSYQLEIGGSTISSNSDLALGCILGLNRVTSHAEKDMFAVSILDEILSPNRPLPLDKFYYHLAFIHLCLKHPVEKKTEFFLELQQQHPGSGYPWTNECPDSPPVSQIMRTQKHFVNDWSTSRLAISDPHGPVHAFSLSAVDWSPFSIEKLKVCFRIPGVDLQWEDPDYEVRRMSLPHELELTSRSPVHRQAIAEILFQELAQKLPWQIVYHVLADMFLEDRLSVLRDKEAVLVFLDKDCLSSFDMCRFAVSLNALDRTVFEFQSSSPLRLSIFGSNVFMHGSGMAGTRFSWE